ncbi:hypothetical protein MMC13_008212 [Lambiella insularis]|nr:hypothetical protein [Lambiella insularis]
MSIDPTSRPRMHRNTSQPSIARSHDARLSIIVEDGDVPPGPYLQPKTQRRPFSKAWLLGSPPRHSYEEPPPKYSLWDVTGPKGEKLMELRHNINANKHIAGRGGWKRLFLLVLMVIAIIVALAVGLSIGLRNRNNSSSSLAPTTPLSINSSSPAEPFPIGSYSLVTFLDSVSVNCSSNPATWRCYPYVTYAQSPSFATATFNWIISGTQDNYTISSSNDPFAINFADIPLTMADEGAANERYTFTTSINKVVVPSSAITSDNSMANCEYNNTVFAAALFTRMPNSYPSNLSATFSATSVATNGNSSSDGFEPWPYAVSVSQIIAGGTGVPACYEVQNGVLDALLPNATQPRSSGEVCSCIYKNYDP